MAHSDTNSLVLKDDPSFVTTEQVSQVHSVSSGLPAGVDDDEQRSLWQNVKKYRKVTYVTFGLTSAILLYGYDNVVVGTVSAMPLFQKDFGEYFEADDKWILPATWLALWNVASPIGAMMGSLFGGWMQDRIGRRLALATSSFLSALAVAVMYISYLPADITGRRVAFLMGKFFQGGAIGAVMAACQTYMSEILPPALRGSGMAFFPVFTLLGQLAGALVIFGALNADNGYAIAFGSQWPFSFIPIVVAFLIPESPTWYVRKRKLDKAYKAQARLDPPGADTKAIVDKLLRDIEHEEQTSKATYAECFNKRNSRRTLIVMFANALPAVFGLQLLAKSSYFLQLINMKASISIIFLILGIVLGLIANCVSVWVVARVGRRTLVISTLLICAALWLSMGIANCFPIVPAVTWWTAISMMLTIVTAGVGVWPASFAIAAETSSLQLRAKTQGLGWFVSAFSAAAAGVALPYIFNPDSGNLRGKVGFTYVATCLLGAGVSWAVIPEMKGRSVLEIDCMFEEGVGAREFKNWRGEVSGMHFLRYMIIHIHRHFEYA
ncbi:MFS general substrate transporter [Dothidotthia symphoricarpi CBS 119687]|uniref:MFS general substrate transporter n=1 Tax=Dothidotthia symphoricarpi CBS 119687 TaxID=1392245 RepID=A0A6A6A258_9PLEO|nr:MFS general substrate transporter [Dothidotthia symphoricarpi CBS 119687]KAF2126072.1 MFS general substrate transporter [Dothidotthia symphoricarpi CBS 119687]